PVGRQEVHAVHEDDPETHGEGERGHELVAVAVEDALHLAVDEVEAELGERLFLAGHAGGRILHDPPEEAQPEDAEDRGDDEGIEIERPEAAVMAALEERQMVPDVPQRGQLLFRGHRTDPGPSYGGLAPGSVFLI